MIIKEIEIPGAFVIHAQYLEDERGFFSRTFCRNEFAEWGLNPDVAQCNISFNRYIGTLRGLHYQAPPYAEDKLVRCSRGKLYDVVVDLRHGSSAFKQWIGLELTDENGIMLYVPKGCAHGFQTLEDNTAVCYQMSEFYHPESARGVRWDDPAFSIQWPAADRAILSDRDRNWPDYLA